MSAFIEMRIQDRLICATRSGISLPVFVLDVFKFRNLKRRVRQENGTETSEIKTF